MLSQYINKSINKSLSSAPFAIINYNYDVTVAVKTLLLSSYFTYGSRLQQKLGYIDFAQTT